MEKSYFGLLPIELLEIIISNLNSKDCLNFINYLRYPCRYEYLDKINYNTILRLKFPDFNNFIREWYPGYHLQYEIHYHDILNSLDKESYRFADQVIYGVLTVADLIFEYRYSIRYPKVYKLMKKLKLDDIEEPNFWIDISYGARELLKIPIGYYTIVDLLKYILYNGRIETQFVANNEFIEYMNYYIYFRNNFNKIVNKSLIFYILLTNDNFIINSIDLGKKIMESFRILKDKYKNMVNLDLVENILAKKLSSIIEK